jgi:hypothetical protein
MSFIQLVNVFLMHSWLVSAPPFTPTQNANLLVSISSCVNTELIPVSELINTCSKPSTARLDRQQAMSIDVSR